VYNYSAYNLRISSELALPELQSSAPGFADVTIRFGNVDWAPTLSAFSQDEMCFEVASGDAHFYWASLGKFRVRAGTAILIDPLPGVEECLLRLPLLGTVLAVLLHQRGYLVLHASAVAVNGESIIFLGNKGWGKSTMAATLYGRGHELLADDVVAVDVGDSGRPMVMPGFPQFKLYPEALMASLGDDFEALPELADGYEKRGRPASDRFAQQPLPLRSVYGLGSGPVSTLKALESQSALLLLITNSYMARFGKQLLHGEEAATHLRQCASVVRQVSVYRLERPCALSLLPAVAQLVEEHLQHT